MELSTLLEARPISIGVSSLSLVGVADDKEDQREELAESVENAHLQPMDLPGYYDSLHAMVVAASPAHALLSDHQFGQGVYAPCTGSQFLAKCYETGQGGVLITNWDGLMLDIRPYRHKIPVLLDPLESDPDVLRGALNLAAREARLREYVPERRPWRVLARIERVDGTEVRVCVPSWDPARTVELPYSAFGAWDNRSVVEGQRFFVRANSGTEDDHDLYLTAIEPPAPTPTFHIPFDAPPTDAP